MDDDEGARGGVQMSATGRVELMQRLARSKGVEFGGPGGFMQQQAPLVLPVMPLPTMRTVAGSFFLLFFSPSPRIFSLSSTGLETAVLIGCVFF